MKRRVLCGLAVFSLLLIASTATGQSTSIHEQIEQTYNFQPHLLNKEQILQKSAVLDEFWTRARAEQAQYIPALRRELTDFKNSRFFLYDGSMLLLSLSDTPADRKIALAAMDRCDLRDVQSRDYFYQVHRMAALGDDTTAAAFHVLEQPSFKVFIPQHALTLGQNYVLIYLLLPTDQNYWLQSAINRLKTEPEQTAQKSLLLLLWYAQTDGADAALDAFANDASKPSTSRTYARELLDRKNKIGAEERRQAAALNEISLRQKRRERLKAVSDEALSDLDDDTLILMAIRMKQ